MKWRMTEDEMKWFYASFKPKFADCHTLALKYAAPHDMILEALPPGFEATADEIEIMCSWGATFTGAVASIPAKYGNKTGSYGLTYLMGTDSAVIFGRELWGEPKKVALMEMTRDGDQVDISVKRYGAEIMKIHAKLIKETDPAPFVNTEALHTKYFISSDGSGLDDAKVVYNLFTNDVKCAYEAGEITLDQIPIPPDIFGSLPLGELKSAAYFECDMYPVGEDIGTIPGKDMMPFAMQRHDPYNIGGGRF